MDRVICPWIKGNVGPDRVEFLVQNAGILIDRILSIP